MIIQQKIMHRIVNVNFEWRLRISLRISSSSTKKENEANIVSNVKNERNEYTSRLIFHVITNRQVALERMHVHLLLAAMFISRFIFKPFYAKLHRYDHLLDVFSCMSAFFFLFSSSSHVQAFAFEKNTRITKRLNGLWTNDESDVFTDLLLL